jgi:hypothetical protein
VARISTFLTPGAIGMLIAASIYSCPVSAADSCREYVTDRQREAAASLIRRSGYDCRAVDSMCPYILSEGFTVACNNFRYVFEIENHGGRWSVKAQ